MSNYYPVQIRHADNSDVQGYELKSGDVQLETLAYNIDKFSVEELKQKKKSFFNFICSKYTDIDRRIMLMIFANMDDDMLEYYKEQYPIEEKTVGKWIYKDCPKRTERYYGKISTDEKIFIEIALHNFQKNFGYKTAI